MTSHDDLIARAVSAHVLRTKVIPAGGEVVEQGARRYVRLFDAAGVTIGAYRELRLPNRPSQLRRLRRDRIPEEQRKK